MKEARAKLSFYRQAPRKVRLVADAIRGLEVIKAEAQLTTLGKRASGPVLKLLKSAIANAEHNEDLSGENLFIKEIFVDQGPTLKRWMPRAHGRATPLRKKTSHITIVLGEIKPQAVKNEVVENQESGIKNQEKSTKIKKKKVDQK